MHVPTKCANTLLLPGVLILTASCSGVQIQTSYDYDPNADFSKLKTYGWLPEGGFANVSQFTVDRVRNIMDEILQAKGYRQDEEPDFLVSMRGGRARASTAGWGWSGLVFRTHEEGTLIADMVDGTTKQLFWTGVMQGVAEPAPTPEEQNERLTVVVAELLANFPPK